MTHSIADPSGGGRRRLAPEARRAASRSTPTVAVAAWRGYAKMAPIHQRWRNYTAEKVLPPSSLDRAQLDCGSSASRRPTWL